MVLPRPDSGAGATAGSRPSGNNTAISQLLDSLTSAKPTTISTVTKNPTLSNGSALGRPGVAAPGIGGPPIGGGATATKIGALTNAPLHPLTESTFDEGRDAFGLRRGAIVRVSDNAAQNNTTAAKQKYVFRFLFNPETVSYTNGSYAGVLSPDARNPKDIYQPLFIGQEAVSFSLLLDRSQEAYEQGIKTRGTLDDVEILYKTINGPLGSGAGFLSLSHVDIHWGPATQNGHPLPVFPCYITSVEITHTQFTPRMCPIRTAIQISAARLVGFSASTGITASSLTSLG